MSDCEISSNTTGIPDSVTECQEPSVDKNRAVRNVQTQHGDYRTVDEENIVVLPLARCHSPEPEVDETVQVEAVIIEPFAEENQKMLAVPMHHPGAVSFHQTQQPLPVPNQTPQQHQQPPPPHQTYQHQMHPALQHHNPAALHQQLHPAAAAAMFTPLSLRTFINPSANHLSLSQQQQLATASVQQSPNPPLQSQSQTQLGAINLNVGVVPIRQNNGPGTISPGTMMMPVKKVLLPDKEKVKIASTEKRKADDGEQIKDLKKAKLETKALKAKRPGFTDERYHETSYYIENGLRKVYPYYFTFTTFTKGRWVGEKILDVFAREFRAHPAEEYERCIKAGTLTVNYEKVPTDYRLKHNDLLANIVHRHEVPVTSQPIAIVHMDDDIVVVNKPASIPEQESATSSHFFSVGNEKYYSYHGLKVFFSVFDSRTRLRLALETSQTLKKTFSPRHETPVLDHPIKIIHLDNDLVVMDKPCSVPVHPCGRYRHNTVVFILAKEYNLKNLRTIHRLDRLTSGLLLFGRSPKKARQMEHQIRNRQVQKEYVCRVEGEFPEGSIECKEPIEVVSYKIGVCKVSPKGKDCTTIFQKLGFNGKTSVVLCKPRTGRMHQIRVHLQFLGYPVVNDPLYNHEVFGPAKGRGGDIGGKTDDQLVRDLINIHNAENWLGIDGDSELSLFKPMKADSDDSLGVLVSKGTMLSDDDLDSISREESPCSDSPRPASLDIDNSLDNMCASVSTSTSCSASTKPHLKVTVATQTGHESPDLTYNLDKMSTDKHCYECKVRYRDPKPQDLVMYLHAWKYRGPGWEYETDLPDWASIDWIDTDCE